MLEVDKGSTILSLVIYLSTFKDDRGSFDSQSKSYYYELSFYAVWVFRDCLKTIQQLEVQYLKFRNITFFVQNRIFR